MLRVLRGRWRLDDARAQDVLVDTWEQCRRIEGRLMGQRRPAAFAMGVLVNCARRDRRVHGRLAARARQCADPSELERVAGEGDPEGRLVDARTWALLSQGVEALRVEQPQAATALELRHLRGLSFREIQAELGLVSEAAARGLEGRARCWLRTWWTRRTGEAPPPRVHVLLLLSVPWRAPRGGGAGLLGGGGALVAAGVVLGGLLLGMGAAVERPRSLGVEPVVAVVAAVAAVEPVAVVAPVVATVAPAPTGPARPRPATVEPPLAGPAPVEPPPAAPPPLPPPAVTPPTAALGPAMQAYGDARERLLAARERPDQLGAARRAYDALLATPLPPAVEELARVDRAELALREGDPHAEALLRELLATRTDPAQRASLVQMLAIVLAARGACKELEALPDGRGGLASAPRDVRQACHRTRRRNP